MLIIDLPGSDLWDESRQEFVTTKPKHIRLEHSLHAIAKWESRYEKPFLSWKTQLQGDELYYYIWCMSLDEDVSIDDIFAMPRDSLEKIVSYMSQKMTATNLQKEGGRGSMASETIYAVMVEYGIPFECQYWHFNRLMALISACQRRMGGDKKLSRSEVLQRNTMLNAQRKAALHTKG